MLMNFWSDFTQWFTQMIQLQEQSLSGTQWSYFRTLKKFFQISVISFATGGNSNTILLAEFLKRWPLKTCNEHFSWIDTESRVLWLWEGLEWFIRKKKEDLLYFCWQLYRPHSQRSMTWVGRFQKSS